LADFDHPSFGDKNLWLITPSSKKASISIVALSVSTSATDIAHRKLYLQLLYAI
jgi:hypothetical protein